MFLLSGYELIGFETMINQFNASRRKPIATIQKLLAIYLILFFVRQ